MATTVTGTKPLIKSGFGGSKPRGPNGNGSSGRNGRDAASRIQSSANRYRIGMWVAMASILMMFTALTSAYIVRSGSSNDWQALAMPRVMWLSTALIILSSLTLETARRKLKGQFLSAHRHWLLASFALGIAFLLSQLFAWRQLVRQGIYVSSNPHSSFFYLLTATHGVHLVAGLIALLFMSLRRRVSGADELTIAKGQAAADAMTLYWHFLDILWIYLFVLLFFWRS